MPITIPELKERLKVRQNAGAIQAAIQHENRVNFHAETSLENLEAGANEFLNVVKGKLPLDKYLLFCKFFRAPVVTNSFVNQKIFATLETVFDGKDTVNNYNFSSSTAADDWEDYRSEIKFDQFFREQGFEAMKTAINSILIIDLPNQQTTDRPSPYMYFLPVSKVIDFELNKDLSFEWIAFESGKDQFAVFDDAQYRIFQKGKNGSYLNATLISESNHELEETPAANFWSKPISKKQPFVKCSPITTELTNLDQLAEVWINKWISDFSSAHPVQWGFESECDYENGSIKCENGFLKSSSERFEFDVLTGEESAREIPERMLLNSDGSLKGCPVCSHSRLMGAGSFIEVPYPTGEEKAVIPPVGIVERDIEALKYQVEEKERLKAEIFTNTTGFSGDPLQKEALNELQVAAAFEQRTKILLNLKQPFEKIQSWAANIVCKLRYGNVYLNNSINYGTKFYLFSPELLLSLYDAARTSMLNDSILDTLYSEYLQAKYRTDAKMLQRMLILNDLEPFRHSTKKDINELYEKGKIGFDACMIKLQFSDLLARFERENGSVVEFGSAIDYGKKIEKINEVLKIYVEEIKPEPVAIPATE